MDVSYFRLFLVLLAHPCWSFSLPRTSQPYTAGVVEFTPDQSIGSANITHNLLAYDNLTAQANLKGVQIIVFPEDGINGYWYLDRDAIYPYLEELSPIPKSPTIIIPCKDPKYDNLTAQANLKGVQIIVFPEDGINGYWYLDRDAIYPYLEELPPIPKSPTIIIPCKDPKYANLPIFQELSCIALRHKVVLVANMGEKQPCTSSDPHCPPDGRYQYNTDVVFENDGSFVTKYRKFNLYGNETKIFDAPLTPEHVMFNTSFGVTFGIFTCNDITFWDPPLVLVEKGVQNFIFPTAWGNTPPYFVSVAFQQTWSLVTGTTLLAANFHNPTYPFLPGTGSGIYSSGTPLSTFVSGEDFAPATGHLIVAELPKGPGMGQDVVDPDRVGLYWQTGLQFVILNGTSPISIAYKSAQANSTLTCSLSYSFKKHATNETYGLGVSLYPHYNAGCALVKCSNASCTGTSYQPTTKASTVFSYISLSADFPKWSVVFPVAFGNNYKLLPPEQLHHEGNTLTIKGANEPLISVSLWSMLLI